MLLANLPKTKQTQASALTRSKPEEVLEQEQQVLPAVKAMHYFGRMPVSGNGTGALVQPKLTINQPGDVYEQEADQMAEQVMQTSLEPMVQRKCAKCEEEEQGVVQTKLHLSTGGNTNPGLSQETLQQAGTGQTIDSKTRSWMEPRFGIDLSQVRIHTGSASEALNDQINAHAFTYGSNIYFNKGQYSPESSEGKKLLAHELSHVVQQSGGVSMQRIQRQERRRRPRARRQQDACPGAVFSREYSRGNDDWAECNYETARIKVDLMLDPCACNGTATNMPLELHYQARLEGKRFTGSQIPNPNGSGTIAEQEGQASHIGSGVRTPGRSTVGGNPPGMSLSEVLPQGSTPNISAPLQLTRDDATPGGIPGDPGDTLTQTLPLGSIPCSGGQKSGQINLGGGFQVISYSISADSTGVSQADITLSEPILMPRRIRTPLIDVTAGGSPYPNFPGTARPGGTGCTCNTTTGVQNGSGCNRGSGGSGFGGQ